MNIEQVSLIVEEQDFENSLIGEVNAKLQGKEILANDRENAKRVLFDAMPNIIASRVKSITPDDFHIQEIEIKMNLKGKVFGSELGGEIVVKFSPTKN